ncbi:MAG: hypothetical protein COV35_10915 [Alphaproteobacteria bacterium CG11_big_fil_rev_8_21_14_0_20_39_49]|nr:MAG: hypothetical protein COV35_10915 [Alphaproteobacteria bacterium CG11_big_fil_rev_8_21_14_0_20_39_49]
MAQSYSLDLRSRVVTYIKEGGSKISASSLYQVSRPTIDKWLRYDDSGDLSPRKAKGKRSKIEKERLVFVLNSQPDAYLHEIAEHFDVSYVAVHAALKRLGITRKKNHALQGTERKKA